MLLSWFICPRVSRGSDGAERVNGRFYFFQTKKMALQAKIINSIKSLMIFADLKNEETRKRLILAMPA